MVEAHPSQCIPSIVNVAIFISCSGPSCGPALCSLGWHLGPMVQGVDDRVEVQGALTRTGANQGFESRFDFPKLLDLAADLLLLRRRPLLDRRAVGSIRASLKSASSFLEAA